MKNIVEMKTVNEIVGNYLKYLDLVIENTKIRIGRISKFKKGIIITRSSVRSEVLDQYEACITFARIANIKIVSVIDSSNNKRSFDNLQEDLQKLKADCIVCITNDRISRNSKELLEIERNGIGIISINS